MPKHNPNKLTTVKIEVTDRLIKKGTPNDDEACPIALAVKKVVAKNVCVQANYEDITLELVVVEPGANVHYDYQVRTPARGFNFMAKMDARDPNDHEEGDELPPLPKPISFNLKIKNRFLKPSLRS